MYLKFGNLSPEEFAKRVGSEFTEDEIAELRSVWSRNATLTGPEDFHIFEDPSITVHIGSPFARAVEIFRAANGRKEFNQEISFHLDEGWKGGNPVVKMDYEYGVAFPNPRLPFSELEVEYEDATLDIEEARKWVAGAQEAGYTTAILVRRPIPASWEAVGDE